ncbi:MAG: hypothetical protein N2511_01390 [Thermodesulfovibrionales bacterium]|nr:hypothetical protein [Thermodesulfovibrionales bacterium]
MSRIKFERIIQRGSFLNSLKNYEEESFEVEVRFDPLLGNTSIYNKLLKGKSKTIYGQADEKLIEEMVNESIKNCILCDNKVDSSTPKYPSKLTEEGRIKKGEASLFPNLFPIGKYHAVISISRSHFLRPNQFTEKLLTDAFLATQIFVQSIYKNDDSPLYLTLNANYLFPAGASIVHPHLQLLITTVPYSYNKKLFEATYDYHKKNNSNYFNDLINEEKKINERYLCNLGNWHWLVPYSPTGNNEIVGIHESKCDFIDFSLEDVRDLCSGISKILSFYESLGFMSFNFSFISARNSSINKGFNCLLKIMTRQNPYKNYRNDDYYLQKILNSELIITLPEDLAKEFKKFQNLE